MVVNDQIIVALDGVNEVKIDNKFKVYPSRGPLMFGPGPPIILRCP